MGSKDGKDAPDKDKEQKSPKKRTRERSDVTSAKASNEEVINQSLTITEGGNPGHLDAELRDGKLITKKTRVKDIV